MTTDLRSVLFMSVLSSIVALATPVLTGHLPATAIPRSDTWCGSQAWPPCSCVRSGGAVFQVVQTFALLRIEGRLDERLRCSRCRPASSGSTRPATSPTGWGLPAIRSMLSGTAVRSIVGGFVLAVELRELRAAGDGMMFQVTTGLATLRVANAEPYVLARWAGLFARQRGPTLRARRWAAAQLAFNGLFTPLASAVLLGVMWTSQRR